MVETAASVIERLGLVRHPERGHYREVFRSDRRVEPGDGRSVRCAATCIHILLAAGEHSRWHPVLSEASLDRLRRPNGDLASLA